MFANLPMQLPAGRYAGQPEKSSSGPIGIPTPQTGGICLTGQAWGKRWDSAEPTRPAATISERRHGNIQEVSAAPFRSAEKAESRVPHLRHGATEFDRSPLREKKHPPKPMTLAHLDATKDACFKNRTLGPAGAREDPRWTSLGQT